MLDFALYYAGGGRVKIPVQARGVRLAWGRSGPQAASAFLPLLRAEAFRLRAAQGLLYAVVTDRQGGIVWRGRVEDRAVADGGLRVGAFGLARSLGDGLYTALWSQATSKDWRPVTENDLAGRMPGRYKLDNNNRLNLELEKGAVYGNGVDIGELTFAGPHLGRREIVAFSASYAITLPTNWQFRLMRAADDFSGATVIQTITGTGSPLSGTISQTFTGSTRLLAQVRNNTGGSYTVTAETGSWFARLTNLRIKTTTESSVLASAIANDVAAAAQKYGQIVARRVVATTRDLLGEAYEDERGDEILADLAGREIYEWGIDSQGIFFFRPRGATRREWLVDALSVEVEESLDVIRNEVYGLYEAADGRPLRTTVASSGQSIRAHGVTRQEVVGAKTTSLATAEAIRDGRLTQATAYATRARVAFGGLYDAGGCRWPLWEMRPGDRVTLRNLSPLLATDIAELGSFVVDFVEYEAESGSLMVEPEVATPTMVTMVVGG